MLTPFNTILISVTLNSNNVAQLNLTPITHFNPHKSINTVKLRVTPPFNSVVQNTELISGLGQFRLDQFKLG